MIRGAIKETCLPIAFAAIIAVLISGCSAEYEVKLAADPEGAGSLSGSGTYEYGETVEVEAREIEGYRFKKRLEDDEAVSEDKTYQFNAVENRTLTAVRELETAVRELD